MSENGLRTWCENIGLSKIYLILIQLGFREIRDFTYLSQNDLELLCNGLDLTYDQKTTFKLALDKKFIEIVRGKK